MIAELKKHWPWLLIPTFFIFCFIAAPFISNKEVPEESRTSELSAYYSNDVPVIQPVESDEIEPDETEIETEPDNNTEPDTELETETEKIVTTDPPIVTTAPPVVTTSPPIVTTSPPVMTTAPPIVTDAPKPSIEIISAPDSIPRGSNATIKIKGIPNTSYTLSIKYASGTVSEAGGLGTKMSDADGYVTWTWSISGNTTRGATVATIKGGGETVYHDFTVN